MNSKKLENQISTNMTILVTGANGQLGNEMRIVSRNSKDHFIFTDVTQQEGCETTYLDITDFSAIRKMVKEQHIDMIVNCAAWTNVDACETDPKLAELAEQLNAVAPLNLAKAMVEVGGWLIHISTDYVFGEEPYNVPCTPYQKGTPTGVYGATKQRGEQNIIMSGVRRVIIRTSWLYSEFGKNFCKTMLALTATKSSLKVVFDQCGTPTYAYDLAQAIMTIIDNPKVGTYHFSNEGVCSWYDFIKMIQDISGQRDCIVLPCHSDEFPSAVKRPSYSVLDKTSIKETFDIEIPYWVDSLRICINNLLSN